MRAPSREHPADVTRLLSTPRTRAPPVIDLVRADVNRRRISQSLAAHFPELRLLMSGDLFRGETFVGELDLVSFERPAAVLC